MSGHTVPVILCSCIVMCPRGEYYKFLRPWQRAVIVEPCGPLNYRVRGEGKRRSLVVHHNRLKPDNTATRGLADPADDSTTQPAALRGPRVIPGLPVVPRFPVVSVLPAVPDPPDVLVLPQEMPFVPRPRDVAVPPPCAEPLPQVPAVPAPERVEPPPAAADHAGPPRPVFTRSGRMVRPPQKYDPDC